MREVIADRRMARRHQMHDPGEGNRHRVVVVGGGFGGLPASRFFGGMPVEVTLIDRRNHHLFQPLLYQVSTGILSQGQVAMPLRHVLRKHKNIKIELAEVTGFDLDRKVVLAHRGPAEAETIEFPFDSLIVAAGAGQSYFGHDEFALYAPGMKTLDDAMEIRRRVLGAFEMAESVDSEAERATWLTIAVVGAGPTGVELAGQIRELATISLAGEFREFEPESVRVLLVDAGKEPLATFGDNLSGHAQQALEQMGVELMMNARVTNIDADGVDVQRGDTTERVRAHTVIWAAGVEASPLAGELAKATGCEVDRAGRIAVHPDLTLPGHPDVFAVGDMTTLNNLPGVAEVAMQGSLHAAATIARRLQGDDTSHDFRYRDLGSVATIGRWRAVCSVADLRLTGLPAWIVWIFVHLTFLNGYSNRLATLARWLRWMLAKGRPERVFSVRHTGGDLSVPIVVLNEIEPNPFPVVNAKQAASKPS
jgi:NADH dehydrogenase